MTESISSISLLERRRREARAYDAQQLKEVQEAEKRRTEPSPRREFPPTVREVQSPEDRLAALLVKGDGELVTVADLRALIEHFEARIDDLEETNNG